VTSRPWMPLYVADYLADTGHLSTVEHGAYALLIMHYWQNSGLPPEDARLARITRLTLREWLAIRDVIAALFREGWRHKRIDAELARARETIDKRSAAGRVAASARYAHRSAGASQSDAIGMRDACETELPRARASQSQPQSPSRSTNENKYPSDFERWWAVYPRKVGKRTALRAFEQVLEGGTTTLAALVSAAERYAAERAGENPTFTKHPDAWLKEERWTDEPAHPDGTPVHPDLLKTWVLMEDPRWVDLSERHVTENGKLPPHTGGQGGTGWYFPNAWLSAPDGGGR
jgi:uncharacterized protein YdaU (DUF1376 family)